MGGVCTDKHTADRVAAADDRSQDSAVDDVGVMMVMMLMA